MTPHQPPHGASDKIFVVVIFFFSWLPRGFFSNLRTACSETLMLRERKASMADRSLSSLTGELLLLVTAAVAFTTFAALRLSSEMGSWREKWDDPRVGVNAAVVWKCGARVCGEWRWSKVSSPEHQSNMSGWPKVTGHTEDRQGTEGRATKVKGHRSHGKEGARSNAGRIQDDTNNPQNHNHNAAPNRRRQERGQMKNWKKNKTKVKINRSQPYKSAYKRKKEKRQKHQLNWRSDKLQQRIKGVW